MAMWRFANESMDMPNIHISTHQLEPGKRSDFWRTIIQPIYEISSFEGDTSAVLEGEITSYSAGSLSIATTRFNSQRYKRDRKLINLANFEFYLIQLITAGTVLGNFDGRDVKASIGDILIIDLARPVESEAAAGSRITTTIPKEMLNRSMNGRNIHGAVLHADSAATRLISHFLEGALRIANDLSPEEGASTEEALANLIASALKGQSYVLDFTTDSSRSLKETIILYIEQNIANVELSVSKLQERFGISRAHLYRLFEEENGISGFIKDKKLDNVLHTLSKLPQRNVTSKQIAFECGFESTQTLNRLFRERFGMTPKELYQSGRLKQIPGGDNMTLHAYLKKQVLNAVQLINQTAAACEPRIHP